MPTFYEGDCIVQITNQKIDKESFAQGFVYREKILGSLKKSIWYCLFFVIIAFIFAILTVKEYVLYKMAVKAIISVLSLIAAVYVTAVKSGVIKKSACNLYESSELMHSPATFKFYRDSFFIDTQYESFSGYWTDISAGVENNERIMLASEWISRPIVIVKTEQNKELTDKLSQHLQKTLVYKYKKKG